jgi:hypothetical protein
MAWVASILLVLVLGAAGVAVALYRRSIHADDAQIQELPPDMLIALGRAKDAARSRAEPERGATDGQPPPADPEVAADS